MVIIFKEEWREINGYPQYLVSNLGNVFSKNVNRVISQSTTRKEDGYKLVWLSKDSHVKGFLVHRLVYEAFNGEIPDGMQINHKDENKQNNQLCNLELVTPEQNARYGTAIKRRIETYNKRHPGEWSQYLKKACINETTGIAYSSVAEAASRTGGKAQSISNACSKRRKTYRNEIWSYL